MVQTIILRRSPEPGKIPTPTSLQLGEIAINTSDGKMFIAKTGITENEIVQVLTTNTFNTGDLNLGGNIVLTGGTYSGDGSDLYNIPYSGITGITNTDNWSLDGNALTTTKNIGSTTDFDVNFIRSGITQYSLTNNGINSNVAYNSGGNITIEKGNPRLRLRDTGYSTHTQGFDIHVSVDEFIIDDNTHNRNILKNHIISATHHTDFDSDVFNFISGSTIYATINNSGLTLSNILAESTDVDKFLVSNAGLIKYRTGTQLLSDIGAFSTPTGLTTNYITKWNGTKLVNSLAFDNGDNFVIGTNTDIDTYSRMYVFGGSNGANIDARPGGGGYDQAIIDLQGGDYATNFNSVHLRYQGINAVGTTLGYSNKNLADLTYNYASGDRAFLIRSVGTSPIVFAVDNEIKGNFGISGLTLSNILAESTDVDKFLVSNDGLIKYRTGTQLLSDIGATPLNGTGASGTWGISITGNAATASNTTLWNSLAIALATYTSGTVPSTLIYNSTNNRVEFGTWTQIQGFLGLGSMAYQATGTYYNASTSDGRYAYVGGGNASGTWGINITGNAATVTNGVYTTDSVLIARSNIGANQDWNTYTTAGVYYVAAGSWTGSSNAPTSAYQYGQLHVFTHGNTVTQIYYTHGVTGHFIRSKFNTSDWVSWQEILTNTNFNEYSPTLTGTGASGTWGISTTGNAATATTLQTARTLTIGNTGRSFDGSQALTWSISDIGAVATTSFINLGTQTFTNSTTTSNLITELNSKGAFVNDGYSITKASWDYAGNNDLTDTGFGTIELAGSVIQVYQDSSGYKHMWLTRPLTGAGGFKMLVYNDQGPGYGPGWKEIITNEVIGTYAPTLTGTGASGTWGISTTGNAASATTLQTARTINGVSFNGSSNITVPSLYDTNYRRITNPGGGEYTTGSSTVTGAIKIIFPFGINAFAPMMKMTIKVYNYYPGKSFDVVVGGHMSGTLWYNTSAYIVGQPDVNRQYIVRFGGDTTNAIIYIGELTSIWDYPQVFITDIQVGYNGYSSQWTTGWSIGFETSAFNNISVTNTNPQVGWYTESATAHALVKRDASGHIYSNYAFSGYVNTTDDVATGTISHIIAKFGDNYHRSTTPSHFISQLALVTTSGTGASGTWGINITGNAATSTRVNGIYGQLISKDDRTIEPNSIDGTTMQFGFTSFNNNNSSPYADYLHLRSYQDGSGGDDNLLMFNKSGLGIRIWQRQYGSATAYSVYKDVAWTDGSNTSGTWGISITGNAATVTNGVYTNSNTSISGDNHITFGPNSGWSSYLRIGGNGRTVSGDSYASIVTTNGNLHIDAGNARATYINYYAGTGGVVFGNGLQGEVASMNSSGDLFKGGTQYVYNSGTWGISTTGNASTATTLQTARTINGVSFNGSSNITVPSIYDTNYRRITNPGGGEYTTGDSLKTGAIKLTFPVVFCNTMLRMTVKVYQYNTGKSFDINIGGYIYGTNVWYNTFAYIIGQPNIERQFTVRFGGTTNPIIYIGELGSTWDYPQIMITNLELGYSGQSVDWTTGWLISFETSSFNNITDTHSNPQIGYGTTSVTANALVLRDGGGDINSRYSFASYHNSSDDVPGGNVTYIMAKFGDNYYRSATAAKVASFITNQSMNIVGTSTNITAYTINQNVGVNNDVTFNTANAYFYYSRYGISVDQNFGYYFSSGSDINYGIYRESGGWSSPFPDLRISFHTGIKIGAHYLYGGTRFYNNSDMATQLMSVGDGDQYVRIANYLYVGQYLNVASGNNENPTIGQIWTSSNGDTYLRKSTPAHFISQLGLVTTSGTGASGTWGINITGGATYLNTSNYILQRGITNADTEFQNTPAGSYRYSGDNASVTNGPGGTWWVYENMRHTNNSNYWGTQIAWGWEDNANKLATRNITSGVFGSWVFYLNSSNYGSYAVPVGGATLTNIFEFRSNLGGYSGTLSAPPLQVHSTSNNSAFMSFHKASNYAVNMGLDADNVFRIGGWSAAANRLQLDMSGNLTIAGTLTEQSSLKYKENIFTLEDALDKVLMLRPVKYNLKGEKKVEIGLIAEEVQELIPELIKYDSENKIDSLSYTRLAAILVEAIKEQQIQINKLKEQINNNYEN